MPSQGLRLKAVKLGVQRQKTPRDHLCVFEGCREMLAEEELAKHFVSGSWGNKDGAKESYC